MHGQSRATQEAPDGKMKIILKTSYNIEILQKRGLCISNDISKYRDVVIQEQNTMNKETFHDLINTCNEIQRNSYRTFFWAKVFLDEKRTRLGTQEAEALIDNVISIKHSITKLSDKERNKREEEGIPTNVYRIVIMNYVRELEESLKVILSCIREWKVLEDG